MKFSIATFALCFANAAVVHAQDGGKKSDGSPGTPMMSIGGKKGMSMPEPTECPAIAPLTCGAEETGSTVTDITACGDFNVLTSGLYTLSSDLTCPSGEFAISINPAVSDVTLDCQGNTISSMDCSQQNQGILIFPTANNVVVKNCNIECFAQGLLVQGDNVLLKNINASNNGEYGVNAPSTGALTIVDSTFSGNSDIGIAKSGGSLTVVDTVANLNGGNGIAVTDAFGAVTALLSGVVANNNGFNAANQEPLNGVRLAFTTQQAGTSSAVLQNVEACGNAGQDIFVNADPADVTAIEMAQSGTRCDCSAGDSGSSITCDCDAVPMDN